MGWQVEAVMKALTDAAVDPMPPVTPVLCFVNGEWPMFRRPSVFEGVLLESERSIVLLFTASEALDAASIDRTARLLAAAFPPR